jgi:hypothetical protein
MATVVRKTFPEAQFFSDAVQNLKVQIGAGAAFHLDVSEVTVTAASATDLPTSIASVNQSRAVYEFHRVDTLAHANADTTNSMVLGPCVDLATAEALANQIKTKFNAHLTQATVHYNNDGVNAVVAANATDLGTLQTLANAIKSALNAHMGAASAPTNVAPSLRLVSA